jgi:hypothetical protein
MTAVFSCTFNIKDIFNDPQVKKVLREREDRYNENMRWLDEDLNRQRGRAICMGWAAHLNRRVRDLSPLDETLDSRIARSEKVRLRWRLALLHCGKFFSAKECLVEKPKIWHCGHGTGVRASREERDMYLQAAHDGLRDKTCSIFHSENQLKAKGNNTHRQYLRFMKCAVEGDIIFFHCTKLGGLTHFGFYTGETTDFPYMNHNGLPEIQTKISVDFWRPLSHSMNGTGNNSTLYEVKPHHKNYENYMIFT